MKGEKVNECVLRMRVRDVVEWCARGEEGPEQSGRQHKERNKQQKTVTKCFATRQINFFLFEQPAGREGGREMLICCFVF